MSRRHVFSTPWQPLILVGAVVLGSGAGCSCGSDTDPSGTPTTGSTGSGGAGNGGGNTGGFGTDGCFAKLQSIAIEPAGSTVTLDGSANPAPLKLTAKGTFEGGSTQQLDPKQLTWTVSRPDDTPPGSIADGVLQPYPFAGGVVTVQATDGCKTGETTVTFFLDATVGMPSDPGDWTGPPVTGAPAPDIVYPSDQTRFPRNLYRTLFQWHSQGFSQFRLVFEGPNSTVTVYTDGVHGLCASANPAAGCWEVDEVAWSFIAGSNSGATATWVVDALDDSTQPPTVRRSDAIEIGFSKQDVEGAIFYWSTTNAGIRRGRISQQDPENYVAGKNPQTVYPNEGAVKCVACHVVSRSGKYLAAPTSASTDSLWVYEVTQAAPPTPLVTDVTNTGGHGFATISPDDAHVVAAWKGKMWMVDRATGAFQVDLPTDALEGTHPDWSPAGDELVFTAGTGDGPSDASLAKIPFTNGQWGQASVFLTPPSGRTYNFPMYSHNAEWIAFNMGKGGHTDKEAQLMLVAAGGGTPIELLNANRVVSNAMTDGQHQNTAPTWAPEGDFHWVAFNSQRAYGVVRPGGNNQIWVAAIDVEKAKTGDDPSFPAFRVPFQGLDEANHRAYWTLDIGSGGGGGAGGGGTGGSGGGTPCSDILTLGEACDPLNDCCEAGSVCDSVDSGVTYQCLQDLPN